MTQFQVTLIYFGSMILNQFVSFLLIPWYWKVLTPQDYGVIAVTEMAGAFAASFFGLGLDMAISRFYYEWPEEKRDVGIGTLWVASWVSTLALGIGIIAGIPHLGILFFPDVLPGFLVQGIIIAMCNSMSGTFLSMLRIKILPWHFAVYNLIAFLLKAFLGIYYVVILNLGIEGYFQANILAGLLSVGLAAVGGFACGTPSWRWCYLRPALFYSLPIMINSVVSSLAGIADRYLLQRFASLETLGLYAIGLKFAALIERFHYTLKLAYAPFLFKIASVSVTDGRSAIARLGFKYVIAITGVGIELILFSPDFIRWINAKAYFPVIAILPAIIGLAIFGTLYGYLSPGLYLAKKTTYIVGLSVFQFAVFILTGPLLIWKFQLSGLISCRYLCQGLHFILTIIFSQHLYQLPLPYFRLILLLVMTVASCFLTLAIIGIPLTISLALKTIISLGIGYFFYRIMNSKSPSL